MKVYVKFSYFLPYVSVIAVLWLVPVQRVPVGDAHVPTMLRSQCEPCRYTRARAVRLVQGWLRMDGTHASHPRRAHAIATRQEALDKD